MKIFHISDHYPIRSHPLLDNIEKAIKYVFENSKWKTIEKTPLMNIGVLKEYGILEMVGSDVKFPKDRVFLKVFFEVWSGECGNYGKGLPKNVPLFRGFVEGERPTPWASEENIGTHKDTYGYLSTLVDLMSPDSKNMSEIGSFNQLVGKPIDVANIIKSIVDKWGNDEDFDIDEIDSPVPTNSEQLVNV